MTSSQNKNEREESEISLETALTIAKMRQSNLHHALEIATQSRCSFNLGRAMRHLTEINAVVAFLESLPQQRMELISLVEED